MPELGRYARELRARFWKPPVADEVREELAAHLAMLEESLVAGGMPPAAARAAARARFGNVERIGERCRREGEARDRRARRSRWLEALRADVRLALRQLWQAPRFAVVAIATLTLGLGAATTIFALADAVLLRPLPFHAPDRLVTVAETNPAGMPFSVSEPNFLDLRARVRQLSSLAAVAGRTPTLEGGAGPEQLRGALASASLFATLGRPPALGRAFTADEDRPGSDRRVAVIGHGLWARRFGGDPRALDSTLVLDGVRHRIVGVAAPGFDFPDGTDVWLPLAADAAAERGDHELELVGRLAPVATLAGARAELAREGARLAALHPASNGGWGTAVQPLTARYVSDETAARVAALLAAVALLLVLACVNVGSLLMARLGARHQELAVRAALGAGRGRIVRQLLTESLVLSAVGTLGGVALAAIAVPLVRRSGSVAVPRLADAAVDWRVLAFAAAACAATGALFGVVPALRAVAGGAGARLRDGARVVASGRPRRALTTASVAAATLLLATAALVGGSFVRLLRSDLGFVPERVLTATVALPASRYPDPERRARFHAELQRRLARLPGVRAAGAVNAAPLTALNTGMGWEPTRGATGRPAEFGHADWRAVTPGYLASVGIPLRRGRAFTADDRHPAPLVEVINEAMARRGWPGRDPLGERLTLANGWTLTVVGVVGDTRHVALDRVAGPTVYLPYGHLPWPSMFLTVRTAGDPEGMAAAVRREVAALDPSLPLADVQSLARRVHDAAAAPRLTTLVLALFATTALVLAAVGLYGLVSYGVAQRTRELGVRLALGASPRGIVRAVLADGVRLGAAGVAVGTLAALAAGRALRTLLFETAPHDGATLAAVAAVVLAVTGLASVAPARRAARVDPVRALRGE